ncbi:outer membrane beta-barrel protein [Hymenobacter sp. UYCo722]|uniref:outer membrane beta-barrel protein n=1 Tax=Hymenobacter sp. UYCo722 TaxID=3156335 RepID=UPI00339A7F33
MFRTLPFFVALLALPQLVYAQNNWRLGYIISLPGDTIRGSVDYGSSSRSAFECRFKPTPAGEAASYAPAQLRGYGFLNDRFYQTQRVMKQAFAGDTTSQVAFAEVLVQGPATLYRFAGGNTSEQYYVRSGTGPLKQLVQLSERVVENGRVFHREKALYRATFAEVFQACPAVQFEVVKAPFNRSSLVRLVRHYNDCVGGGQVVSAVAASPRRSYVLLEAVAGSQFSMLDFDVDNPVQRISLPSSSSPVVGLALQQYLPLMGNRWSLRVELLYLRQHYEGEFHTSSPYRTFAYQEHVRVQLDQLRVPIEVRFSPFGKRIKPFVALGASLGFALKNTNESQYRYLPTVDYSPWQQAFQVRNLEQGLLAGVGVATQLPNQRHFAAELRAERGNGFSNVLGIGTLITRYSLLLSYDLSKQSR